MIHSNQTGHRRVRWNKGKLVGQKPPLKRKEIGVFFIVTVITMLHCNGR